MDDFTDSVNVALQHRFLDPHEPKSFDGQNGKEVSTCMRVCVCVRPSVLGILDFGPECTKIVDIIFTTLYSSDFETRELKSRVISVFVAIRSTKSKFIKITPGACLKSFLLNSFLPNHSGAILSDFLKKRMILSKSHSYRKSLGKAMILTTMSPWAAKITRNIKLKK